MRQDDIGAEVKRLKGSCD